MKCIYCDKEKPEIEFSLEHILSQGLVGTKAPELFKTRQVCHRCNSICGLWVDGVFQKNWFLKNSGSLESLHYYDFDSTNPLPLTYMGKTGDIPIERGQECELWLGPCGDSIYHFRKKSDDRYATFVAGNPIDLRQDGGKAFIFLATDSLFWVPRVLVSFYAHFKNATRYTCTEFPNLHSNIQLFNTPSNHELNIIEHIKAFHRQDKPHKCNISIDTTFDLRFLAKAAIGIGYNIFGREFLATPYAKELKNALWAKTTNEKLESKIRGAGFFEEKNQILNKIYRWEGGHTITLLAVGQDLAMSILVYGEKLLTICIADNLQFPEHRGLYEGQVYISIPIRNVFKGPYSLPFYIAYRNNKNLIPELAEIESMKNDIAALPPKRSTNYPKH